MNRYSRIPGVIAVLLAMGVLVAIVAIAQPPPAGRHVILLTLVWVGTCEIVFVALPALSFWGWRRSADTWAPARKARGVALTRAAWGLSVAGIALIATALAPLLVALIYNKFCDTSLVKLSPSLDSAMCGPGLAGLALLTWVKAVRSGARCDAIVPAVLAGGATLVYGLPLVGDVVLLGMNHWDLTYDPMLFSVLLAHAAVVGGSVFAVLNIALAGAWPSSIPPVAPPTDPMQQAPEPTPPPPRP